MNKMELFFIARRWTDHLFSIKNKVEEYIVVLVEKRRRRGEEKKRRTTEENRKRRWHAPTVILYLRVRAARANQNRGKSKIAVVITR